MPEVLINLFHLVSFYFAERCSDRNPVYVRADTGVSLKELQDFWFRTGGQVWELTESGRRSSIAAHFVTAPGDESP